MKSQARTTAGGRTRTDLSPRQLGKRASRSKRRYRFLLLLLLLAFGRVVNCTWMNSDQVAFLEREEVYSHSEAQGVLNGAVIVNVAICPDYHYAALYALNTAIGEELREPFYTRKSIDRCAVVISQIPCQLPMQSNPFDVLTLYRAAIRVCGPEKSGL